MGGGGGPKGRGKNGGTGEAKIERMPEKRKPQDLRRKRMEERNLQLLSKVPAAPVPGKVFVQLARSRRGKRSRFWFRVLLTHPIHSTYLTLRYLTSPYG